MGANRGIRTFNNLVLFPEDPSATQEDAVRSLGRSEELIKKRNARLCARLYWYKRETGLDYMVVKKRLEEEFEISIATIEKIVQEVESEVVLKRMKNENPANTWFRKTYWWMNWDKNAIPR